MLWQDQLAARPTWKVKSWCWRILPASGPDGPPKPGRRGILHSGQARRLGAGPLRPRPPVAQTGVLIVASRSGKGDRTSKDKGPVPFSGSQGHWQRNIEMTDTITLPEKKEKEEQKTKRQPPYNVVLHND